MWVTAVLFRRWFRRGDVVMTVAYMVVATPENVDDPNSAKQMIPLVM